MRRAACAAPAIAAAMLATTAVHAADAQPDPFFAAGAQWALTGAPASIGAPAAWCVSTGAGITVAVVDSGADFTHPDLKGKLLAGAQYTGEVPTNGPPSAGPGDVAAVTDGEGHGTMVAGVIAADTGNGIGMTGVAPDARILVVKVLDESGRGSDADIANGIRWAADHGAQVINVSLGPSNNLDNYVDSDVPPAVEYAGSRNVNVTIAAGNAVFPLFNTYGPGSGALVVGALARDGSLASYSNTGAGIDVYAPGGDSKGGLGTQGILTTDLHDEYAHVDGTSFAAPMVAGALALLRATGDSAAVARARILSTAVTRHGLPELDAAAALGAHGTCPMPRTSVAVSPQSTAPPGTGGAALATPAAQAARNPGAPATAPAGGSGHTLLIAGLAAGAAVAGGASWTGFLAWRRERRRRGVLATMKRAATIGRASDGDDRRR